MNGDDLVAWLRQQIDEDERIARAALPDPTLDPPWRDIPQFDEGAFSGNDLAHIARHDPARVLREVEAKRLLLDMWEDADLGRHLPEGVYQGRDQDEQESDVAVADALDGVIRALAWPYADRPGYQEAWKP